MPQFIPFERTPQTRVLLEEITEAHFEYYSAAGPLGPGGWVDEWPKVGNELPRAMAILFSTSSEPSRLQPAAVVASVQDYRRLQQ